MVHSGLILCHGCAGAAVQPATTNPVVASNTVIINNNNNNNNGGGGGNGGYYSPLGTIFRAVGIPVLGTYGGAWGGTPAGTWGGGEPYAINPNYRPRTLDGKP